MSVVVWDGKVLATDCAANDGVVQWRSTKAWYHGDNDDRVILSGTGPLQSIIQMRDWFIAGANPGAFPHTQIAHTCHFIVVSPYVGLYRYETDPTPIPHEFDVCAFGEGREFAYGALAMGATATQAVEVANMYSPHCDLGVATYTLGG